MEIPIACTLTGGELADRLGSWASLQPALRSVTRHNGELRVAFDAAVGAFTLAGLVAAEAACCAFVDWQLVSEGTGAKLVPSFGGYFGQDNGRPVFVFTKNAWIAGVVGLPEKQADTEARTLAGRLN